MNWEDPLYDEWEEARSARQDADPEWDGPDQCDAELSWPDEDEQS